MEDLSSKKRVRVDSDDSGLDSSPEVKKLRDDLIDFLDDADPAMSSSDLDSVMKSLQDEISPSGASSPSPPPPPAPIVDLTSDSGESQPQIGYLLEASDDELGLPPPPPPQNELISVSSDSSGIAEFWQIEDQIPSYDSFELGIGASYDENNSTEFVEFDGLFDHSDLYYDDSADFSDSWRHETLPAQ